VHSEQIKLNRQLRQNFSAGDAYKRISQIIVKTKRMKKAFFLLPSVVLILSFSACNNGKTIPEKNTEPIRDTFQVVTSKTFPKALNFLIVSDFGWNGYAHQQEVADQMEKTADSVDAKLIATCGDNFQISGVASDRDPLWTSNFENVYKGNSLQVDWYPVLGNHDYRGNTQAQIDYSKISRRWRLTNQYYSIAREVNDSISVRLIFIDTPAMIEEYRNNPEKYPDAYKQNIDKQLKWLEDILKKSSEQWILVFGHHPIYSASQKHGNTEEMIAKVKPLLEKYKVQAYFCGHDHDFQHLHEKGHMLDYIVTGTGGEIRPNSMNEMSVFSRSEPGFSVISLRSDSMKICFVGTKGNIIYKFGRGIR
jgi:predicted MPP superfamily phosphohydrolase